MQPASGRLRLFSFIAFACVCNCALAQGQTAGSAPLAVSPHQSQLYTTLFHNPSNNNGYEEFVQAADLIQGNQDVELAIEAGATLAFKRRVLGMPACSRALSLLREGLAKPVGSPRAGYDDSTTFPELAVFRKLARLLKTEQYVDFADGRVDAAIDSLRVGLAFGYRIQTDTFIAGLVGIAIDSIVVNEFAAHFDQLSIYQCDSVLQTVKQMLEAENPAIRLMAAEKTGVFNTLDKRRNDAGAILTFLEDAVSASDTADAEAVGTLKNRLAAAPASLNSILNDAEAKISSLYDAAAANMRLPLADRKPLIMDTSNSPAAILARLVSIDPQRIIDKYATDQARLRLLGVHILIRRYQWDHNALPASLAELHAGEMVMDPFTGSLLNYKRDLDRYTLTSAGALNQEEALNASAQQRTPVKLR